MKLTINRITLTNFFLLIFYLTVYSACRGGKTPEKDKWVDWGV